MLRDGEEKERYSSVMFAYMSDELSMDEESGTCS